VKGMEKDGLAEAVRRLGEGLNDKHIPDGVETRCAVCWRVIGSEDEPCAVCGGTERALRNISPPD